MMRILRLAACAFVMTPAQLWPNVLGLAFLLPALLFFDQDWSGPVGIIGLVFIALVPLLAGGPSMRAIAARRGFRLRPHGARQLFLAASLVLVALATFAAVLIVHANASIPGRTPVDFGPVGLVTLSAFALAWVATFAIVGARMLFYVGIAAVISARYWLPFAQRLPHATWLLAGAAILAWAWLGFMLNRPQGVTFMKPFSKPAGDVHSRSVRGRRATPWEGARLYLLGSTSYWPFIAPTGILLLLALLSTSGRVPGLRAQGAFLIFAAQICLASGAQTSFAITRRARLLWLKRGSDRREAFDLCERVALFGFALSSAGLTLAFATLAAFAFPRDQWLQAGGYWVVQHLVALCVLYLGLLCVRGWTWSAILLAMGMVGLWIFCLSAPRPGAGEPAFWVRALIPGVGVLALILRTAARWRWEHIDWTLLRASNLPSPGR